MIGRYGFGVSKLKRSMAGCIRRSSIQTWLMYCRLRTARILLIHMRALANEIAKNLVLAGIGSLTVLDSSIVTDDDLGAQFFISEEDIGHNVW